MAIELAEKVQRDVAAVLPRLKQANADLATAVAAVKEGETPLQALEAVASVLAAVAATLEGPEFAKLSEAAAGP